jgi:thiaminase
MLSRTLFLSYVLTSGNYVLTLIAQGEIMLISFNEMTPKEAYECHQHFLFHEFADLCLSEGFEPTMEQLIAIINAKVDNLEPV